MFGRDGHKPGTRALVPRKRKGRQDGQGPSMRVGCATDQCGAAKGRCSVATDTGSICSV